ncbi:hypothetical protein B0J18DRAFT_237665 [Chaetomium sp. MPI-SDFR-AT-0129]|nr:hypothetical protein B0J18DRAFT_237665 [Chaetomium sp. MPI-SDFR-AT-0129]
MPSVAQEAPLVQPAKKRRRDDDDHQILTPHLIPRSIFDEKTTHNFDSSHHHHHDFPSTARKVIPLAPGKRQRTVADANPEADGEPMQRSPPHSPSHLRIHHHPHRDHHNARDTSYADHKSRSPPPAAIASRGNSAALMNRCHICSRKPSRKSDLDSFANCQGCGQRTCYVCIRECLGWAPGSREPGQQRQNGQPGIPTPITATPVEDAGETSFTMLDADDESGQDQQHPQRVEEGWTRGGGHRRVVCSRCCVERGQDGEVVCLGCFPFAEG